MSTQADWVSPPPAPAPFKDIANTRASSAQEKAQLMMVLNEHLRNIPEKVKSGGSIEQVRRWKSDHALSKKTATSSRASAHEIRSAIARMESWRND